MAKITGAVHLPAEDQKELLRIAQSGQPGSEEAVEKLIITSMGLVGSIVRRSHQKGVDQLDLMQNGVLGLFEAIKRFEFTFGSFSTYATWWIRAYVNRARQPYWSIRVNKRYFVSPVSLQKLIPGRRKDSQEKVLLQFMSSGSVSGESIAMARSEFTYCCRRLRKALDLLREKYFQDEESWLIFSTRFGLNNELDVVKPTLVAKRLKLEKDEVTRVIAGAIKYGKRRSLFSNTQDLINQIDKIKNLAEALGLTAQEAISRHLNIK